MNIQILSVAQQEAEEASDYYEEQRKGLGNEFVQAFERTLKEIQRFPGLGTNMEANCRRRRFKKFPLRLCVSDSR